MSPDLVEYLNKTYPNLYRDKCLIEIEDGYFTIIDILSKVLEGVEQRFSFSKISMNKSRLKIRVDYDNAANKTERNSIINVFDDLRCIAQNIAMNYCECCGMPATIDLIHGRLAGCCRNCLKEAYEQDAVNGYEAELIEKLPLDIKGKLPKSEADAVNAIISEHMLIIDREAQIKFPPALFNIVNETVLIVWSKIICDKDSVTLKNITWSPEFGLNIELISGSENDVQFCRLANRFARLLAGWIDLNSGQLMSSV